LVRRMLIMFVAGSMMLALTAGTALAKATQFTVNSVINDPAHVYEEDECQTSEPVAYSGSRHLLVHSTTDAQGKEHTVFVNNTQNDTATGLESGESYQVNEVNTDQSDSPTSTSTLQCN
jgi:hypothetical protein